jgi:hypothetical protein
MSYHLKVHKIVEDKPTEHNEPMVKNGQKVLELLKFSKIRRNSLVLSAKRFVEFFESVRATLASLDSYLQWDEQNSAILKE